MNISKYFYWNNLFSFQEIKNINSLINKQKKIKENLKLKAKQSKKTSTVYHIEMQYLKKHIGKALASIIKCNQDNFGYDIFNFNECPAINFNIYEKGQEYEWHRDSETFKASDIKLTALINISDSPFLGGEFNLLDSQNPTVAHELSTPGSMLLFNSFVLHKVNPVKNGVRKTLTIFVKGPAFK